MGLVEQKNKNIDINITVKYSIFLFGIFLYIVWLFKTYPGNLHSNNVDLQKFFNGEFPYTLDFVLKNTYYFEITILYDLLKFLKINLDNDYIGFSIHILSSTLKGAFLFLILKKILKIKNNIIIFIIIFSLMTIGNLLVEGNSNKVSWVSHMNFSPSYFGQIFRLIFLYFLLIENFFLLTILSALMVMIGLKSTYFIIGCGVLYSIIFFKDKKKLLWILSPILCVLFFFPEFNQGLNSKEKIFILNTMMEWDRYETVFHLQPKIKILLLVVSFIIFPILLKKIKSEKFRHFSIIVYLISLLNFIFGFIYFKYLYELIPIPQIGLLSPTRSMETFQMIFWIIISIYLINLKIPGINKMIFFSSIFLIHLSTIGLIIASILIFFNLTLLTLKKNFKLNFDNFTNKNFLLLFFLILLSPSILYLGYKKYENNFNFYSLKKINKWSIPNAIDREQIDIALTLKSCKDFILHSPLQGHFVRTIAGKSRFNGHPIMNIYSISYIEEVQKRKNINQELIKHLKNSDKVSGEIIKKLKNYELVLLLKKEYTDKFPKKIPYDKISDNFNLIYLIEGNNLKEFRENCLKKRI